MFTSIGSSLVSHWNNNIVWYRISTGGLYGRLSTGVFSVWYVISTGGLYGGLSTGVFSDKTSLTHLDIHCWVLVTVTTDSTKQSWSGRPQLADSGCPLDWRLSYNTEDMNLDYSVCHSQMSLYFLWVESLNLAHSEMYSIQHYVIKFVSDLLQVGGFLRYFGFLQQ